MRQEDLAVKKISQVLPSPGQAPRNEGSSGGTGQTPTEGNGSVLGDVNEERTLSIDDSLRILGLIASLTLLAMCVCVCLCSRVRVRVFT